MPKLCAVGLWICGIWLVIQYISSPTAHNFWWAIVAFGIGGFLWSASD